MKKFEPKFEDFEIKLDSFASFTRLEFGKHHERADKIDLTIEAVKKLIKKLSD